MTIDTLCFSDYDPVTGAPNPDGFTGIEDASVFTTESESGYALGSRLTMGGGGYGTGSGFPPVIFQGVRNGKYLNLAFFCRFDPGFDDEDVIIIALGPSINPAQVNVRRIDIFPLHVGLGAGPAGTPIYDAPGAPADNHYNIHHNQVPRQVEHYRGQATGDPWTQTAYAPNNIKIQVRSWSPPTLQNLTQSVGSQTLPAGTFNVNSTASFPPSGYFGVNGNLVNYSGKTNNSFTGCVGGSGQIPAGTPVDVSEAAWSVEVQLPLQRGTGADQGGNDWIDLPDSFGLFFNVIRVGTGFQPSQTHYATQFTFPVVPGRTITGILNDKTNQLIPTSWYGKGLIPSLQTGGGPNLGQGVKFVNGELSIGARLATASAFSSLGHNINGTAANTIVAQIQNDSPTDDAPGVTAEFRLANWGLGSAGYPLWEPIKDNVTGSPNPTVPQMVQHNSGSVELTMNWTLDSTQKTNYAPPHHHQCMWVQLDTHQTPPGVPVNFVQSSMRRNMDFINLSELTRPAEISGVGYPKPKIGTDHDFVFFTNVRQIQISKERERLGPMLFGLNRTPNIGPNLPPTDTTIWLWIVHGYRRTGDTIIIGNKTFEILDDTPGSFGYIAQHAGLQDRLKYEFTGGGIKHLGGNIHSLKVPDGGSVTINTRVKAGSAPRACDYNPSDPWWLRLLKAICRLVYRLIDLIKGDT
jgi:hypothetical protein